VSLNDATFNNIVAISRFSW